LVVRLPLILLIILRLTLLRLILLRLIRSRLILLLLRRRTWVLLLRRGNRLQRAYADGKCEYADNSAAKSISE
jgi:hypothetical protein